jgi:hypothetical protein
MSTTIVKYLELGFEGFFMCRIATDPDPTNERRGMSGYTMALADEAPLDQVIRLQMDIDQQHDDTILRDPALQVLRSQEVGRLFRDHPGERPALGVFVNQVRFDGEEADDALKELFLRTRVSLLDRAGHPPRDLQGGAGVFSGPIFESRNNIVGSDDTMMFVVNPFEIAIYKDDPTHPLLRAKDDIDPCDPARELWQIDDPKLYNRRLSKRVETSSTEVLAATGVYDFFTYFADRKRYLEEVIADHQARLEHFHDNPKDRERLELAIQKARSRIYQIDFWGDRVSSKLGFLVGWQFDINGGKSADDASLGGKVGTEQAWPVTFWFGGWDGDLLTGYMRGTLKIPFEPTPKKK